ncbi:MAG: CRISPR-associated endonuclease Cas2 [Wenzhouxiangellaceae bacterium]|nr:CRISPR-associated endonuclease Cas2 [Wenzhouxiangellaceae bacterium]
MIVCYDIADSKLRGKLADSLLNIGLVRLQQSVFWGRLRAADEKAVARELRARIEQPDRAFFCRLRLSEVVEQNGFGYLPSELTERNPNHVFID